MQNESITIARNSEAEDNSPDKEGRAMSGNTHRLSVEKLGEIARFPIPEGWQAAPSDSSEWAQPGYSKDFRPDDAPNAVLSVFHRGSSVPHAAFNAFKEILEEPPHRLNAAEIELIAQVLSKLADEDAFEIYQAETKAIAARKVLAVDGLWKLSGLLFHGIFIKSENEEVQEIFFEAAAQDFSKHISHVHASINSIAWMASVSA